MLISTLICTYEFKVQTIESLDRIIAVISASWFSSHSLKYLILRLLIFAIADFKVCNDLEAEIGQSVR